MEEEERDEMVAGGVGDGQAMSAAEELSSGMTATLPELAGRGKYQEALALLRSMKEDATTASLPTPMHYHKVVMACKTGRQWALALDLLREMRQISGMQVICRKSICSGPSLVIAILTHPSL